MDTIYIYHCSPYTHIRTRARITWDSGQINTFLQLTTPLSHSILSSSSSLFLHELPSLTPLLTLRPRFSTSSQFLNFLLFVISKLFIYFRLCLIFISFLSNLIFIDFSLYLSRILEILHHHLYFDVVPKTNCI